MPGIKRIVPKWLYNKFFLQSLLALFMVGMCAFFISHEHLEMVKIREQLTECNPWYVLLGLVLTVCYVLLMGLIYIETFKSVGKKVSFSSTIKLYLKRNVLSVFLPAGGFSSLVFFTKEVENEGATKSQIHLASTLYGFVSMASVVVVAIPIVGYAVAMNSVQKSAFWGFIGLVVLTFLFAILLYSLIKRTWAYRLLRQLKPEWAISLDEVISQNIRLKNVLIGLFFSVLIEIIGVLHLYVAMLALGCEPSLMAAMFGYVTMVLLLMASPFLRGLGAIEVSVTYILGQYGYPLVLASAMTLLYRFFEFWLPLA
ncbi:MAG: lysylphosphatidylglycerol synthase domain-containing protein, partial [Bacteroidota bacterium]|nr:lysylphosphatidylglycerol synthase domain-containing protein [Bacteroidota bacterium]